MDLLWLMGEGTEIGEAVKNSIMVAVALEAMNSVHSYLIHQIERRF